MSRNSSFPVNSHEWLQNIYIQERTHSLKKKRKNVLLSQDYDEIRSISKLWFSLNLCSVKEIKKTFLKTL